MPRVCYFVYNLGGYSGAALQAINLAKHVSANVTVFNIGKTYTEDTPKNIQILNMPSTPLRRGLRLIYEFFIRARFDAIHLHGQFLLPMLLARLTRTPYIVKTTLMGDDDFDSLSEHPLGRLRLYLTKNATINVALTEQLLSINQKHIPKDKIRLIPNGVEVPPQVATDTDRRNDFYFSGVISKRKNTLLAIEFFERNYSKLEDSRLFVIGPNQPYGLGREYDESYIEACHKYVIEKNLEKKVIFTGLLSQHEAKKIFSQCKALLFFSEYEGLPNVVLEAMAANCVPIISSLGGTAREIIGSTGGFIIPEDSPPSILQIENLIKEKLPRKRAEDVFSFKKISIIYNEIYECLQTRKQ